MASNLACIGLAVDNEEAFESLVDTMMAGGTEIGRRGKVTVYRWQDPSGARCVFTVRGNSIVGLLPSYAGAVGAHLAEVLPLTDDLASADVVAADGVVQTRVAIELEEQAFLGPAAANGPATIVSFGVEVQIHADADAFAASDASLLGEPDDDSPLRMAAESFIPMGLFGSSGEPDAHAMLNGVVLSAQQRTTELTGQPFVVARVRTVGFETEVCLPGWPDLSPGNVVSGVVFLAGSMPSLVG